MLYRFAGHVPSLAPSRRWVWGSCALPCRVEREGFERATKTVIWPSSSGVCLGSLVIDMEPILRNWAVFRPRFIDEMGKDVKGCAFCGRNMNMPGSLSALACKLGG